MARKKVELYPGADAVEREKSRAAACFPDFREPYGEPVPDMIGGKPNPAAFPRWSPERVLSWLNID